jgi:cation:H+ antiporter
LLFILGLILIIKGGDYFVDSAAWIAKVTHIPEVIIGATIVSLATTFPEAMVSVFSSLNKQPDMAVGNAIGSIICNTGLILGIYNLIKPTKINTKVYTFKSLLLITYLLVFWYMSINRIISGFEASILLLLLFTYIVFNVAVVSYKKSIARNTIVYEKHTAREYTFQISRFIIGILLIVIGARLLVSQGTLMAKSWGVSEALISLTLIALGTSLPELATAISALLKGHTGLSIGNILGANILNITMVIGLSAQISPLALNKQAFYFDIPSAIIITALLVIPSILFKKISRLHAVLLLSGYAAYLFILFYINNLV